MGYPQPQHPQHAQHVQHLQHPQHPQHVQHGQHPQHSQHSPHHRNLHHAQHYQIRHLKKRPMVPGIRAPANRGVPMVDPRMVASAAVDPRMVVSAAVRPRDLKEWLIVELRRRGETEKAEQVTRIHPSVPDIVERLKAIAGKEAWHAVKVANQNRSGHDPMRGYPPERPHFAMPPSAMQNRRLTLGAQTPSPSPRPMFTGSRSEYDHYMASRRFMAQPVRHDEEADGTLHRVRRRVRDRLISPDGALYRLQDAGPDVPMNLHSAICQWIEAALTSCLRSIGRGEPGRPARISAAHMARWLGTGCAILPQPLRWPPSVLALIRADSARVAMGVRLAGEKRPRVTHTRKVVKVARTEPRGDVPQNMQQRIVPGRMPGAPVVNGHGFSAGGSAKRKLVTKIRTPAPSMPQGSYRADGTGPRRMFVKKPISHAAHVSHTPHVSHVSQSPHAAHVSHTPHVSQHSAHSPHLQHTQHSQHSQHLQHSEHSQHFHASSAERAGAAHYPGPERAERPVVAPAPAARPPVVDTSF